MDCTFKATYYLDGRLETIKTDDWGTLPRDNVLIIDVLFNGRKHRLLGADYYWFSNNQYGMIYDGSCCDAGSVSWTISKDGITKDKQQILPDTSTLIIGKMLADSEWYRIEEEIRSWQLTEIS